MPFSASDIAAFLAAGPELGTVTVTIGASSYTGLLDEPGKVITNLGEELQTTEPVLLVATATAALVTRNSTVITINGTTYQAFDKIEDKRSGFVSLPLTTDF